LYRWNFGDNSRPPASGQKVSHTYTKQGIFNATLTVTDASGATATNSAWIYTGGSIPYPGVQPCIPMLLPC
jgi:PKD repeat protein